MSSSPSSPSSPSSSSSSSSSSSGSSCDVTPDAADVAEQESAYHAAAFQIGESLVLNLGLFPHHLSSFDHLLSSLLPKIISEQSPIISVDSRKQVVHQVFFECLRFCRPAQEDEPGVFKAYRARDLHAPKLSLMSSVRVSVRHKVFVQDPAGPVGRMRLTSHALAHNVTLFELPVMDGSELTNDYDDLDSVNRERYGSTLVINGHRKLVLIQTRLRNNYPFVRTLPPNHRYAYVCEIRSAHPNKMRSSSTTKIYLTREKQGLLPTVVVAVPFVPGKLPVTVLFRLLGVTRLRDMVALSAGSEDYATFSRVRAMFLACPGRLDPLCDSMNASVEDILVYVATVLRGAQATGSAKTVHTRSRDSHVTSMRKLLSSEILPHLGHEDSPGVLAQKASYLGMALSRLLGLRAGTVKPDDPDSCVHKRYSTAGQTLAIKIRQLLRNHCKMLAASIARQCENSKHVDVRDLMKADKVTRPLRSCLARGNFSVSQSDNSTQAGVSQVVNSMNRLSRIAHMTTVNQPLSRDGSQTSARQLRSTHWGIIDAAHTPDGRGIGLVSHHTLFADFRPGHDGDTLVAVVQSIHLCQPLTTALLPPGRRATTLVMVNDEAVARTAFPKALVATIRRMRGDFALPKDVSVRYTLGILYVRGDEGEAIRPVLRADKISEILKMVQRYGKYEPHHLYPQLLASHCIEYITKAEEATLRVAHSFRQLVVTEDGLCDQQAFTHVEIDPTTAIFGAISGIIPHPNHNQGPRDVYFCAMAPQAMGARHPMFHAYQLDVQSYALDYPQKQLARTMTSKLVQGVDDSESVTQLYMVAVLPADGLGQEDAVVGNRASFQRGLGASTKYTILREVASAHGNSDREYFCYPPDGPALVNRKAGSAHGIDRETGLLKVGVTLQPGDIYCGKVLDCVVHRTTPGTGVTESVRRVIDRSSMWKGNGPAVVDSVREIHRNGIHSVIIGLREAHTPDVGDKFSSLAAQKGVLSALWSQEDMPFTAEGYTPDLIFSSHGLSSRMTIGMLREMVGTQIAIINGKEFDATGFRVVPTAQQDTAARAGVGMHTFMCGKTGNIIGRGFMCMASYMLQRHTVAGKVHARARGPRNAITRQAVEGRNNNGGLKMGTMEMSTLASSGSIATLSETMTLHDGRECVVCGCGRVMDVKQDVVEETCGTCDGTEGGPRTIFIPHVTLVLYWELLASGVEMRFVPDKEARGGVRMEPPCRR